METDFRSKYWIRKIRQKIFKINSICCEGNLKNFSSKNLLESFTKFLEIFVIFGWKLFGQIFLSNVLVEIFFPRMFSAHQISNVSASLFIFDGGRGRGDHKRITGGGGVDLRGWDGWRAVALFPGNPPPPPPPPGSGGLAIAGPHWTNKLAPVNAYARRRRWRGRATNRHHHAIVAHDDDENDDDENDDGRCFKPCMTMPTRMQSTNLRYEWCPPLSPSKIFMGDTRHYYYSVHATLHWPMSSLVFYSLFFQSLHVQNGGGIGGSQVCWRGFMKQKGKQDDDDYDDDDGRGSLMMEKFLHLELRWWDWRWGERGWLKLALTPC